MTASSLTTTKNATESKRLLKLLMTHNDIILLLKLEVIHTIGK
jgi:hypothetical protein